MFIFILLCWPLFDLLIFKALCCRLFLFKWKNSTSHFAFGSEQLFIIFVKMFFLPHSYCFLSLDAKHPTTEPKQQNPPQIRKPPNQIQPKQSLFLFMLNKMGISLQLVIKCPFPISFSSNDSFANSGCYF